MFHGNLDMTSTVADGSLLNSSHLFVSSFRYGKPQFLMAKTCFSTISPQQSYRKPTKNDSF